ncbi:MAG: hypothetical protein ACUVV4_03125 [Candidatus Bathyarchaeia archaeon]
MFRDIEVTPEEEEELIRKVATVIHNNGLEAAAILMIETVKPLSYIGGQMGRLFISPFLPAFGDKIELGGEKLIRVFEKRENVEKLLNMIEEMAREDDARKVEKTAEAKEKPKNLWRRLIPF